MAKTDKSPDLSDHDLLIRIDERVNKIGRCLSNHLAHHWAVTIGVVSVTIGAVVSMLVMFMRTRN